MRSLSYITVILLLVNVLFATRYYLYTTKPPTLTHEAIKPSIHLLNTKLYLEEDNYQRSISELMNGIEEIEDFQAELNGAGKDELSESLEQLQLIHEKASESRIKNDSIINASVQMLLTLTYTQVKAAENYANADELVETRKALSHAMYHVKNALILSEGSKKSYEVQIYAEMNDLVKDRSLSSNQVRARIEEVIDQLENSTVEFS